MKKSDKKTEQQIVDALTQACESSLKQFKGFQWLTHTVNYKNLSHSLRIYCVFDTKDQLKLFLTSNDKLAMTKLIQQALFSINVNMANAQQQLRFDCEEDCQSENNGNWAKRLR